MVGFTSAHLQVAACRLLTVDLTSQKEGKGAVGVSFIRALIPLMRAPPSWPHHLPNTITLGDRISTYRTWGTQIVSPLYANYKVLCTMWVQLGSQSDNGCTGLCWGCHSTTHTLPLCWYRTKRRKEFDTFQFFGAGPVRHEVSSQVLGQCLSPSEPR
jgi:hypothetical protein